MASYPFPVPETPPDEGAFHYTYFGEDWLPILLTLLQQVRNPDVWDNPPDDITGQVDELSWMLTVNSGAPMFPQHASFFHKQATIIAGNQMSWVVDANEFEAGTWAQTPAAINNNFTQTCLLAAGDYRLEIIGRAQPSAGIVTWKFDDVNITTSDDWYAAANSQNVFHTYNFTCETDGLHTLDGKVASKNGSSTDYLLRLNQYWIRKI